MASIRVTYVGMEGEGKSLTAAKQDAARKAEQALTGSYSPRLVSLRGWTYLLHRAPAGWYAGLLTSYANTIRPDSDLCSHGTYSTCKEAEAMARLDLCQLAWSHKIGEDSGLDMLIADAKLDYRQQGELRSWVRFQLRYKSGKEAFGLNDNEAHHYASGMLHLVRPDLDPVTCQPLAVPSVAKPSPEDQAAQLRSWGVPSNKRAV